MASKKPPKELEVPLISAAQKGDLKRVRLLLQTGADVDATDAEAPEIHPGLNMAYREDESGSTPLMEALQYGSTELVRVMLDAGANMHALKDNGTTPLMWAAQAGSLGSVQLLLEGGADVNRHDTDGWTALSRAAIRGNPEVVDALLKAGAEIQGTGGRMALQIAATRGHGEIVQKLLAAGADVNALDQDRWTVLDHVARQLEMATVRKDLPKANLERVLAILKKAGAKSSAGKGQSAEEEPIEAEPKPVPDFGDEAGKEGFRRAVERLRVICRADPQPLEDTNRGISFAVSEEMAELILSRHHAHFLDQGHFLFRCVSNHGIGGQPDKLSLLPTADKYRVIEAMQTNGANCDVTNEDIIHWLKDLEKEQPFELTGIGSDFLEGKFTSPLKNLRKLAKKMYEFCPDIVDQGTGSVPELVMELKKSNRLYLWWD
jgi:ankyrin repeat protein